MSTFLYINVNILKGGRPTWSMGEKSYRHKKIVGKNICDCKVEKRGKMCFKTASANGKVDIFWGITKSSSFCYFFGGMNENE